MVTRTTTDSVLVPVAAAAALVAAAAAHAGISAQGSGPAAPSLISPDELKSSAGPLGHSQNDRPVPAAASPLGDPDGGNALEGLGWWMGGTGGLGAPGEGAALLGAGGPGAAPSGGAGLESIAALIAGRPAWLDAEVARGARAPFAGGGGPPAPVPAPAAFCLLGLAAIARIRRRRRGGKSGLFFAG